MVAKFLVLVAFVAAVSAVDIEHPHIPEYAYSYSVQDPHTGDFKSQFESRSGDVVKGQYSLADSDGTKRIVDYFADPLSGFNAQVSKVPLTDAAVAPVVASKHAIPAAHVTPYAHTYAAGLGYNYPYGYPYHGHYNQAHGYYGYPGYFGHYY